MSDVVDVQDPVSSASSRLDQFIGGLMLRKDATGVADERERRVGHEAAAFGYVVQTFTVPWAVAAGVWVFGRPAVPALLVVFAAFYVADLARVAYQVRRRVRLLADGGYAWWRTYRLSAASWAYMIHIVVSMGVILVGVVHAYGEEFWNRPTGSGPFTAIMVACYVLATAPGAVLLWARRSQREKAVEGD